MERAMELEGRNICRICLTQDEINANFADIFQTPGLTMELLASGNVEVSCARILKQQKLDKFLLL